MQEQREDAWRGYVNQVTYGLDLDRRVPDDAVARVADELVRQWFFTHPVDDYYEAVVAALSSDAQIAYADEGEDEEWVRDFLSRLRAALDDRRPWPQAAFSRGNRDDWMDLQTAPAVARVPLSRQDVQDRLNRGFTPVSSTEGEVHVLVLRLRTGQLVALRAGGSYTEAGVDLLTHADPAATLADFRELTGIDAR